MSDSVSAIHFGYKMLQNLCNNSSVGRDAAKSRQKVVKSRACEGEKRQRRSVTERERGTVGLLK